MGEEIFGGSIAAALRTILAEIKGVRAEVKDVRDDNAHQWQAIREQQANCGNFRVDIERRISNGKTKASNGTGISVKVIALSLLGAGLVIGGTIAGVGYFVLKARGVL